MKRKYCKRYTHWNQAGADSGSGTEGSDEGWAQDEELSERTLKWRVKKNSEKRAATKAAKAAVDKSLNPRTGKPYGLYRKTPKRKGGFRSEVYDETLLNGIFKPERRTAREFV